MENTIELWSKLREIHPSRIARVSEQFNPTNESIQDFLNRLSDFCSVVSVASDKCGTIGNPYEQAADDLGVLLCAAEKLSGLYAIHPRERA